MCDAQGDASTAERSWTAALGIAEASGDSTGRAYGLAGCGLAAMTSNPRPAAELLSLAALLADDLGEDWLSSLVGIWSATLDRAAGKLTEAAARLADIVTRTRGHGDWNLTCVALINLALVNMSLGRDDAARAQLVECLQLLAAEGTQVNMEFAVALLAMIAARNGDWKRAATLLGGSRNVSLEEETMIHPSYLPETESLLETKTQALQALGERSFDQAWADGCTMDVSSLVAFATNAADRVKSS